MAPRRTRPATELSKFIDDALKRKGLTHNQFSRKVGIKPSTLSDLKLRQEAVAPDRAMIREWAEVLELSKGEEAILFELLQLAHSPGYVQDLVASLRPPKPPRAAQPPTDFDNDSK